MQSAAIIAVTITLLSLAGRSVGQQGFIAIGDWGEPILDIQARVADAMAIYAEGFQPQLIQTCGDNFYQNGIHSVDDWRVDELWRYMYNQSSLVNLPWYIAVGNHDYGLGVGEEWVQVELSTVEPRWIFPNLWHDYYIYQDGASVHMIVIDSEALKSQTNNYTVMMTWLDTTLANSQGDWKVVTSHHPIFSCDDTGSVFQTMYDNVLPILERYNADVFLAGHDHNLQLLQKIGDPSYVDFVISGAGGALADVQIPNCEVDLELGYGIQKTLYAREYGFVSFTATPTTLRMDFVNESNVILLSYTRSK